MQGDERNDAELMAAHVAGDPDAFGVLFTRHRERLWAVALRTSGHPEDAADALQNALISAFQRAHTYRQGAAVSTWLHRVVVNACLDLHRRNTVRRTYAEPEGFEPTQERRIGGAGSVISPEGAALDHERRDAVNEALAALSFEQRAALVLVDMEGLSIDEAALALGCAPGTVKSRCSRGRAKLAPLLRGWTESATAQAAVVEVLPVLGGNLSGSHAVKTGRSEEVSTSE